MLREISAIVIAAMAMGLGPVVIAGPLDEDAVAAERVDDKTTALRLYRQLAGQGVLEAYRRLGYFYEIGYAVERDWLEAAKWYARAVDLGDASPA